MSSSTTNQPQSSPSENQQIQKLPEKTLSTKNLFTHYFLIHDFLLAMVKGPSNNSKFFDLKIEVNESMKKAASLGGKVGQIGVFSALFLYCMKARTIKFKLLYGFLYMYWIQHFYTLGAYTGILIKMPGIFSKVGDYYLNNEALNERNPFLILNKEMTTNLQYEDTREILRKVFREEKIEEKSFMVNEYFTKNKEKYFSEEEGTLVQKPNLKLKYLDCFLSRYIYYTFTRWSTRKLTKYGLIKPDY